MDVGASWENIPGEVSSGITVSNEKVDTTSKESQTANGMQELVPCGLRSAAIQAAGVVRDGITKTAFNFLAQSAAFGEIGLFRLLDGVSVIYQGSFLIASFARTGEHNGAEQWTLSLDSSGVLGTGTEIPIPPLGPYDQSYILSVRKVVEAYAGKCMRVRRSSNNQERDIPFKDGWIDEADLLSFVGSGNGFVTAWYNQTPQYGTTSFVMTNVVRQPKIVENGVIHRSGAKQKPTVFFRWTTEYLGRAGGGYSVYAAANGVFISMLTSKIPDSYFGDSTTSMFWEFPANGINGLGIGRYWLPDIKNHRILIGNDLFYVDDSDIYLSTPFVDYSVSCTPAGVATVYRKGEKALSTNVQRIDGWVGLVNQFQITCGGYSYNMNISEVIVQSQVWSEAMQESLAQNQKEVFGTPGGY
jgi:predicted secreted protein